MSGTSGCLTRRSPTDSPPPWTMLRTPAGRPASAKISTKRWPSIGRVAGGLEDDRVAADEGGRDLPARDGDGEVPRRDRADDPDRHADAHLELVRHLRRRRLAEEAATLAGHVEGHVDRLLDVAARLGAHLAHLAHHQLGQLVLALDEALRDPEEDLATPGRRRQAPALVRFLRGLDRAIDVVHGRARERPDRLAGRGIRGVERLVAGGVHPLAADVVLRSLSRCGRHLAPCRFSDVDSRRVWWSAARRRGAMVVPRQGRRELRSRRLRARLRTQSRASSAARRHAAFRTLLGSPCRPR